jgi:hypothetical protein
MGHRVESLARVVAGVLGAVLLFAAVSKALHGTETVRTLRFAWEQALVVGGVLDVEGSAGVVTTLATHSARGLIVVEGVLGAMVLLGRLRAWSVASTAVLFTGFVVFLLVLIRAKADVGCGCGLPDGGPARATNVASALRAGVLAGLAWFVLLVMMMSRSRRVPVGAALSPPRAS